MTYVLGINELYHDISAALIKDGEVLGVIEEERLNRIKHTPGLCWGGKEPELSMQWLFDAFGVRDSDIDAVAISYHMNSYLAVKTIVDAVVANLRRMTLKNIIKQRIGSDDPAAKVVYGNIVGYFYNRKKFLAQLRRRFKRVFEIKHHLCHAASAFRMSGFDKANILVIDGLGEDHSTSLFIGDANTISKPIRQYSQYQSMGMLYKTITFLLGFGYFGDGKLMGLSSYGEFDPKYEGILEVSRHDYRVNLEQIRMVGPYARRYKMGDPILQEHKNIAKTIQTQLERAAVQLAEYLYKITGYRKLCIAGGVGLNCNMNGALIGQDFVDELFVQPGAMDMGTAIGGALEAYAMLGHESKTTLKTVAYGPGYSDEQIEAALKRAGLSYYRSADAPKEAAQMIADNKIVGWFQGRMEFGPRALGYRTIMGNPCNPEMKDLVNKVKDRELWRPLAPSVLYEDTADWFEDAADSAFMTLNFKYKDGMGEKVPSVRHTDNTARIQTVHEDENPRYHRCISEFKKLTGASMIMNTSFNRRIEPIVCSIENAIETFLKTPIDYLVASDFVVSKNGKKD